MTTENDGARERARAKVAKLMAMATDGRGNAFEAEAALRQAESMMRAHGIEAAELTAGAAMQFDFAEVIVPIEPQAIEAPLWVNIIAAGVGPFTDCLPAYMSGNNRTAAAFRFRGEASDVAFAAWLFSSLVLDCRRRAGAFEGSRAARESFRKGYAVRMQIRMAEFRAAREEAHAAGNGRALVVVSDKLAKRDAHFDDDTSEQQPIKRAHIDVNAAAAGMLAADRAGLNRPVAGPQARKALT